MRDLTRRVDNFIGEKWTSHIGDLRTTNFGLDTATVYRMNDQKISGDQRISLNFTMLKVSLTRRTFLMLVGLASVRGWIDASHKEACAEQMSSVLPNWSPEARRRLLKEQESMYKRLSREAGWGNDPRRAYEHFVMPPIPQESISVEQFKKTFEPIWKDAKGWGEIGKAIEAEQHRYRKIELPTIYEDPNWYPMLTGMSVSIENVLRKTPWPISNRPLLGSLPSGNTYAKTVRIHETGEYLILFDQGLFAYAHEMSNVVAKAVPPLVPDGERVRFASEFDAAAALETHSGMLDQFQKILYAYVIEGNPRRVPRFPLTIDYLPTAGMLLRSSELFVLGHEYSHMVLGHFKGANRIAASFGGEPAEEIVKNWDEEYGADEAGMSIMMRIMMDEGAGEFGLAYWGADFYLTACDILDRCIRLLGTGSEQDSRENSNTHPPMYRRRERLRSILHDIYTDDQKAVNGAISMGRDLQTVMEMLWDRSRLYWSTLRSNPKIKVSSIWK